MAPVIFKLLTLDPSVGLDEFASKLKGLDTDKRPLWFGKVHHWMHEPQFSTTALLGTGQEIQRWDYLLVMSHDLPEELLVCIETSWSVTADSPDGFPSAQDKTASLVAKPTPALPDGWSPSNHAGIESVKIPEGASFTLDLSSRPMGSDKAAPGKTCREFVKEFGTTHPGPIVMFNLLSYVPGGREVYFDGYVGGFLKTLNPLYGGDAVQFGWGVNGWTSKADEGDDGGQWEDLALVWYPSLWHFAKMIDDPEYVELDRKFKPTSLRDNPLACCTEIVL